MNKHSVDLGSVQETMLVPLLSRALETARPNGLLSDPLAVEIVDQLDYDFSRWRGGSNMSQGCVRTRIFDEIALQFLSEHPEGAIVEIGCGLNTRFERIDNGRATWFELDLPDALALRRRFFEDGPRRTMIAGSVFDEEWMEPVRNADKPTLFLSEAVIIYFEESQVQQAIVQIAKKFPQAWLATDICTSKMTTPEMAKKQMDRLGISSWFKWACDDPAALEAWHPGIEFLGAQTYADVKPEIVAQMPSVWRTLTRFAPFVVRAMLKNYRIGHYRLSA
ncbi:MAG: class I SAM-dependent methyltransferase [Pseudomonadota bacterium]